MRWRSSIGCRHLKMVHALATAICVCVCACVRAGGYVHTCIHLSERVKHFTVNGLLNITATLYNRSRSKMCWVHYNITHTALALCLTCFMSFCSNTPHQYTSLHTLHPLILTCICLMAGGLLVKRDVRMSHDVTSDRQTTWHQTVTRRKRFPNP